MTQTALNAQQKQDVVKVNSIAASGGTATVDLDIGVGDYTDRLVHLEFEVHLNNVSASHLNKSAVLYAAIIASNKNGVVATVAAKASSSNPINSNTTGFYNTSRAQVCDTALDTATAVATATGTVLRLTITNNGSVGSVEVSAIVFRSWKVSGSS